MDWKSSLEALRAGLPDTAAMPEELTSPQAAPSVESADRQFTAEKARLDIILDKKGRKGKAATIIAGFTVDDETVEAIARKLKHQLGTGGSARGGEILIQGDKRREVADALSRLGLKNRVI